MIRVKLFKNGVGVFSPDDNKVASFDVDGHHVAYLFVVGRSCVEKQKLFADRVWAVPFEEPQLVVPDPFFLVFLNLLLREPDFVFKRVEPLDLLQVANFFQNFFRGMRIGYFVVFACVYEVCVSVLFQVLVREAGFNHTLDRDFFFWVQKIASLVALGLRVGSSLSPYILRECFLILERQLVDFLLTNPEQPGKLLSYGYRRRIGGI